MTPPPMTPPNLPSLIERIREATGPDRRLDREIALALGYTRCPTGTGAETFKDPNGTYIGTAPRFTESIDAAMTTIDSDWRLEHLEEKLHGGWKVELHRRSYDQAIQAEAATPALALLIATLDARMATGEKG